MKPAKGDDRAQVSTADLIVVVLITMAVIGVVFGLLALLLQSEPVPLVITGIAMVIFCGLGILLVRRGIVKPVGIAFVVILFCMFTGVTLMNGGLESTGPINFFTVILISGLVLGRWAGVGMAAASGFVVVGVAILEQMNRLPAANLPSTPGSSLAVYVVNYALTAVFLGFAMRLAQKALSRAWRTEAELTRSNRELRMKTKELERYQQQLEDLVEERTGELAEMQNELLARERLAVLGQLTATISHEIRNPIGTVRNAVFSIRDGLARGQDQRIQRAIDLAERNIDRCNNIIAELIDYSRTREPNLEETQIDAWLAELFREIDIPEGVEMSYRPDLGVAIRIDRAQFRRAVENVVSNALQAMALVEEGGRRLIVTTRSGDHRLEMHFQDSGPGMSGEVRERVLDPLFSTKDFGLGLGMSIVKNVMQVHDGGVELQSKEGKGTDVILWIPDSAVCPGGGARPDRP